MGTGLFRTGRKGEEIVTLMLLHCYLFNIVLLDQGQEQYRHDVPNGLLLHQSFLCMYPYVMLKTGRKEEEIVN